VPEEPVEPAEPVDYCVDADGNELIPNSNLTPEDKYPPTVSFPFGSSQQPCECGL